MKELKQFIKESLLDTEDEIYNRMDLNPIERIFLAKNREEYNNAALQLFELCERIDVNADAYGNPGKTPSKARQEWLENEGKDIVSETDFLLAPYGYMEGQYCSSRWGSYNEAFSLTIGNPFKNDYFCINYDVNSCECGSDKYHVYLKKCTTNKQNVLGCDKRKYELSNKLGIDIKNAPTEAWWELKTCPFFILPDQYVKYIKKIYKKAGWPAETILNK
jgi:hypothetical protein